MSDLKDAAWEDLTPFRMTPEEIDTVIQEASGCVVTWARKDGHPMGVFVWHVPMKEGIVLASTNNRPKTGAWRRDPRTTVIFEVENKGAVSIVGRVEHLPGRDLVHRWCAGLADRKGYTGGERERWMFHMDTEDREAFRLVPEKYITFAQGKLEW